MMEDFERGSFAFDLVGIGGTFDHLHVGHKSLLKVAFRLGKKVAIGLTTESLLGDKKYKENLQSYEEREENLRNYIENEIYIPPEDYTIIPLEDPFGPAITVAELQAHVSSIETYQGAIMINDFRVKNGLNPVVLVIIPLIINEEGNKISSTDIRASL